MTYQGIEFCKDRIADFCRRHRIRKLSLFGSILRDDFRPESDIDVLVEFEPGARVGLVNAKARRRKDAKKKLLDSLRRCDLASLR